MSPVAGASGRRPVPDHSRRATGWHNLADPVRLDVLTPAQALDLLTQIIGGAASGDPDSAAKLCAELGFLPLAIEQVGAYLAEASITPQDYLDLLEHYPAEMYQATPRWRRRPHHRPDLARHPGPAR